MKGCLASGLPFIFGLLFDERFESAEVRQNGHVPLPQTVEQVSSGHVMLAVAMMMSMNGSSYEIPGN